MVVKYLCVADLTFKIKRGPACLCTCINAKFSFLETWIIFAHASLADNWTTRATTSYKISKFSIFKQVVCLISFISLTPNRRLGWQLASLEPASRSSGRDQSLVRGGWLSSCPRQALANARCRFAKEPWWRKTLIKATRTWKLALWYDHNNSNHSPNCEKAVVKLVSNVAKPTNNDLVQWNTIF